MSAAAMAVAAGKVRESTILTDPPASCVGATCDHAKERGLSTRPFGLTGKDEFPSAGGARTCAYEMNP